MDDIEIFGRLCQLTQQLRAYQPFLQQTGPAPQVVEGARKLVAALRGLDGDARNVVDGALKDAIARELKAAREAASIIIMCLP